MMVASKVIDTTNKDDDVNDDTSASHVASREMG
jgi:hypothetical protein